jgi:membrane associated rhomboid family serine protease
LFKSTGVATRTLIFINVLVYLGQVSSSGALTDRLFYTPMATLTEPWRMITSGFAHSDNLTSDPTSIFHIAINMYTLFILGNLLEPMLGTRRFTVLYMLSVFGGSVAVLVLGEPGGGVLGASGGVFGLMGAYFVVLRTLGQNQVSIAGVIAFNLVFSFINAGVSWQAHVGGLVVGAAIAFLYSRTRQSNQLQIQNIGLVAFAAALVVVSFVRATSFLA